MIKTSKTHFNIEIENKTRESFSYSFKFSKNLFTDCPYTLPLKSTDKA